MSLASDENDRSSPEPKKHCRPTRKFDLANKEFWRKSPDKFHILIGCTGSVAAIKIPELVGNITQEVKKSCKQYEDKFVVRVIGTENGLKFFNSDDVDCPVLTDEDEWNTWKNRGDPIVHIELR